MAGLCSLRTFLFVRACLRSFVRLVVCSFVLLFILFSFHFTELRKLNVILSSELALCVKQRSVHPRHTASLCCGFDFLTASSFKVRFNIGFSSTFLHLRIDLFGSFFAMAGTFYSREKLRDVFEFVRQSLVSDWQPFVLSEATRQLTDDNASLIDLGLVSTYGEDSLHDTMISPGKFLVYNFINFPINLPSSLLKMYFLLYLGVR